MTERQVVRRRVRRTVGGVDIAADVNAVVATSGPEDSGNASVAVASSRSAPIIQVRRRRAATKGHAS